MIYLQYGAMFFLGQALHLLLIKIPSLRKKVALQNNTFDIRQWWKDDWNVILGTNIIGILCLIGLDELLNWKPEIQNTVKWFFAGVGAFGSSIAMHYLSRFEPKVAAVFDIKSNISDAVTGPTNNVRDLIEKGTEVTGQDITIAPKQENNKL